MKRRTATLLALASLVSAALFGGLSGCNTINSIGPNCDRSVTTNPPVKYTGGSIANGVYMSSAWTGELLYFPAGMRYELQHGLGEVPRFVEIWLSFDHCGTKNATIAPAAGNQAELRSIDADKLVVVNGSCVDYWLLVTAGTGSGEPDPPVEMGDAGTDGGGDSGSCE